MQNITYYSLIIAVSLVLFGEVSFAQQADSTKKRSLILEFRGLTGADRVNMNINLSTEDVRDSLSALVEKDAELTEVQKQELRKSVTEAYAPIDKIAKDFFADRSQLNQLSEEAIFRLYDTTFNEAELGEVIAFYRSPTGQKTAAFLATLSAQAQERFIAVVIPKLQSLLQPVIEAETVKLKQRVADAKVGKKTI